MFIPWKATLVTAADGASERLTTMRFSDTVFLFRKKYAPASDPEMGLMPVFFSFYSNFGKMLENSANIWYYIINLVFANGSIAMVVSYNRLFKLLVDKNISVADLRKETGLSSSTFTKLRRNEAVTITVLLKVCDYLDCNIEYVCSFEKSK